MLFRNIANRTANIGKLKNRRNHWLTGKILFKYKIKIIKNLIPNIGSAKQVMLKRRCSVFSPATQPYIFNTTQIFYNLSILIYSFILK
jgi:hypothetical protein